LLWDITNGLKRDYLPSEWNEYHEKNTVSSQPTTGRKEEKKCREYYEFAGRVQRAAIGRCRRFRGRGSGGNARWSRACSAGRRLRAPLFTAEERKERSAARSPARCGPARSLNRSQCGRPGGLRAAPECGEVLQRVGGAAGEVGSGRRDGTCDGEAEKEKN